MKLPIIQGIIRRRILANFRVDPEVMRRQLPNRFKPKLQSGFAVAGICLIRLEQVRPRWFPAFAGINSENAAHRVAVLWPEGEKGREGVFIPRRDTGSILTNLGGGRIFPGEHNLAVFDVKERADEIDLRMRSNDGAVSVRVAGNVGGQFPQTSCFPTLEAASSFFEPGSLGYSVTRESGRLDGIELRTKSWKVELLQVTTVESSYFSDEKRFPRGSVEFDCALIMRNIKHEWHSAEDLYV